MPPTSLTAIIRETARLLYPGRVVLGTTTSGPDATSILDSNNLANTDGHANQYDGEFVRIDEKVTTGPDVGLFRRVSDGGFAGATGDLTVAAFGSTVESGTDFSLHPTLRPPELEAAANRILSQAHHRALHPVSKVTNHDYETEAAGDGNLVGDNWTLTATGTFVQNQTAGRIAYGRFAGQFDGAAINDSVRGDNIPVNEGESWLAWVPVSVDVGTAVLRVIDRTNGDALIDSALTTEEALTELAFQFTIPSGCREIAVDLRGNEANAVIFWGPSVVIPQGQFTTALPSWLVNRNLLLGAVELPLGPLTLGAGEDMAYRSLRRSPIDLPFTTEFYPLHANPRRIVIGTRRNALRPAFIKAWRPFAELTEANTSPTTEMDGDTVINGTLGAAHKMIADHLKPIDAARSLVHEAESAKRFEAYFDLLGRNGYSRGIESETVRAKRVPVRLR